MFIAHPSTMASLSRAIFFFWSLKLVSYSPVLPNSIRIDLFSLFNSLLINHHERKLITAEALNRQASTGRLSLSYIIRIKTSTSFRNHIVKQEMNRIGEVNGEGIYFSPMVHIVAEES